MSRSEESLEERIYLSPPHIGQSEEEYVQEAFDTNWIAPAGPNIGAFEEEFSEAVGASHAVAVSSGTAALHLALRLVGVESGDEVFVSTFTFCASVNPILYLGGTPVFIGSERTSWNMDPELLEEALAARAEEGALPAAIVVVHLYGQPANMETIMEVCNRYDVPVVEDAAEALGATCGGQVPGTFGTVGVFSFNGNKIITTSGGGMVVTEEKDLAQYARKLSTQAREDVPHYEHTEVGYNYRMSNVLAGIGRGQLEKLEERVAARRDIFRRYREELGDLPGISFMPEAPWGRHTRWLTCLTIDSEEFGADHETVRQVLEAEDIESRPLWKPMHLQPVYESYTYVGGQVSERLFQRGLCLPSGSSLQPDTQMHIIELIRDMRR
jgi:pyridoxal phosphate-dependent aminotransferase EpsN